MEIEPIRAIGIDLSKVRLQQELYNLGLKVNIDTLNQSDKAILRYIALMKQTEKAQGDMGKTLDLKLGHMKVISYENRAKSVKPKLISTRHYGKMVA